MNYRWVSLLIVSVASFLSVLDLFIVNVALPSIRDGIHGTNGDSQLVMALYLLGHAAFLITGGRMGEYYGYKRIFVWSILLFTIASGCCAIANNAMQLNIARFFQGAFAAFMVPQSIAFIQLLFNGNKRSKALNVYGAIGGIASVVGQSLGGILPELWGWRSLFVVNVPIGFLAAIIAGYYLKEPAIKTTGKPDYSGVLLLCIGLITLIYPLIRGRETGWPLWSLMLLPVSFLLLTGFIIDQQRKQKNHAPFLIDLTLFTNRNFNWGLATVIAYFIVQDSYFFITTMLMQAGMGYSPHVTGYYFVAQGIGFVVAALASIHLFDRFGKRVLQAGVLLMLLMLLFQMTGVISYAYLFLYGIGCGAVLPSLLTLALKNIIPSLAGTAAGTYVTFQQIAIALGVCITGGLFLQLAGDHNWLQAYRYATAVNIFFLIMVSIFLFILKE